jgi:rSAM/selenodomain-associated transferase 2
LSLILPVYREEEALGPLVERLRREAGDEVEILVVDGHPDRTSLAAAAASLVRAGAVGLGTDQGRAVQMNAAATRARGDVLMFLHADTRLPPGWAGDVARIMAIEDIAAGAFDLRIDSSSALVRFIGRVATLRSRLTRVPYGDQALFLRRAWFERLQGFARIPVMEDLDLMTRLRRQGGRTGFVSNPVVTSARRWETEGVILCTLRNWGIRLLYHMGVAPRRLAGFYKVAGESDGPKPDMTPGPQDRAGQ